MSDPGATPRRGRGATGVKVLVIAVLVAAAALIWLYLKRPVPPARPPAPVPVETVRTKVGNLDRSITLDSFVESTSNVSVHPKVSGTLTSLSVDVGSRVKAGETIAEIDPKPYELELNRAKALYDGAQNLFDRQKKLYASGATSQQNFDQAKAQFQNAQAQYQLAKLHLDYTKITAPIDGRVVQRNVSAGQEVSSSVSIVVITNTHSLMLRTAVPEAYSRLFERKRSTMPISATIPALGSQHYRLHIRSISPAMDVKTKTFTVECSFVKDPSGVVPGMFAQVTFVTDRHAHVPYLPYGALVGGDTLWYVENGKAQFVTFTPSYHNDEYFQVPAKYERYTFILAGQHFLSAGAPVTVVSPSQAK